MKKRPCSEINALINWDPVWSNLERRDYRKYVKEGKSCIFRGILKRNVTQELENYFAIFLVIKLNCRDKWEEKGGRKEQSPVLFSSEGGERHRQSTSPDGQAKVCRRGLYPFISCFFEHVVLCGSHPADTELYHGRRNFKDTNPLMSSLLVIFVWGGEAIL